MTPTPGPWAYDGVRVYSPTADEKYTVTRADGTEVESDHSLIALVYACGGGSAAANRRLIAASPLMLKALHDVWVLAATLDIGNYERSQLRDVVAAAIEEAEDRGEEVTP